MYQKAIQLIRDHLDRIQKDRDTLVLTSTPFTIAVKGETAAIRHFDSGRYNFSASWENCSSFDSLTADKLLRSMQQRTSLDLEVISVIALRERSHEIYSELLTNITPLAS